MKANDILQELDVIEVESGANKNFKSQPKNGGLPSIPKVQSKGKFSSWNNQEDTKKNSDTQANFMDEVDELLLEQELLSPTSATKTMNKISSKHQLSSNESPDGK